MKHLSGIITAILLCLTATSPVHAQLFPKSTADQVMQDAEQKAISDPQSACTGFQQAADLYRSISQSATQQANSIPTTEPSSRKVELNRIADEAFRGEMTARNRASQVCNMTKPPAPKEKPKS